MTLASPSGAIRSDTQLRHKNILKDVDVDVESHKITITSGI